MKSNIKRLQTGFTLIELMIGMLVGLIAVAATISIFTSIVRSNSDYLKMVRLNQELNAVMTLMTRDLKRAGFSNAATGVTSENVFMMGANDIAIESASGGTGNTCITFSYDLDSDGLLDCPSGCPSSDGSDERFGYRIDSTTHAIEMRQSGNACGNTFGNEITDKDVIKVNALTFTDDSLYLTTSTALPPEIRYIGISLTGQLVNDPTVTRTITERVRIRNDRP